MTSATTLIITDALAPPFEAARAHLAAADAVMGRLCRHLAPLEAASSEDIYYDLLSCIIDQQIHYRSGGRWFNRFLAVFEGGYPHPHLVVRLEATALGSLKLPEAKLAACRQLAEAALVQDWQSWAWQHEPDEAIAERLAALKGIGPWTVQTVLLFTCRRPDILPPADYQLGKYLPLLYGLPPGATLPDKITQAWRPHRSLACRYVWAFAKLPARQQQALLS